VVGEAGLEPGDQLGLDEFELEHDKSVVVVTADIESPPVTFESAVLEATNLHQRSWSIDRVCRSRIRTLFGGRSVAPANQGRV
jgi:hypothetical protein